MEDLQLDTRDLGPGLLLRRGENWFSVQVVAGGVWRGDENWFWCVLCCGWWLEVMKWCCGVEVVRCFGGGGGDGSGFVLVVVLTDLYVLFIGGVFLVLVAVSALRWCFGSGGGGGGWLRWCLAEAFLGLGSCPGAPERARTLGVAEGCSSLLRFAGLWYLVELYCIRC
ncbi:hypothetical protein QL285_097199 [Trifolium repens]|nr:hypothetical protein QL285_097199 [Trifolium repens]